MSRRSSDPSQPGSGNKPLTDLCFPSRRESGRPAPGRRPHSSTVLGPVTEKTSHLSVVGAGQGVMRAASHLHHFLALQVARDQHRGHDWTDGGCRHRTVAVLAPSKQQSVCSWVQRYSNGLQDEKVGPLRSDKFSSGLKCRSRPTAVGKTWTSPKKPAISGQEEQLQ